MSLLVVGVLTSSSGVGRDQHRWQGDTYQSMFDFVEQSHVSEASSLI